MGRAEMMEANVFSMKILAYQFTKSTHQHINPSKHHHISKSPHQLISNWDVCNGSSIQVLIATGVLYP
jgi:hypothetical protein